MSAELEAAPSYLPVTLLINGNRVYAKPGQTILEVVREQKLDAIPTLCNDPRLEPYGSCFLCVVEVKGSPRLLPACVTRVRDGMEVITRSERIINTRRAALELLLSDHYADCICPARDACPAGVDIQGYLGLAGLGYYAEALALIKEQNPLPVVCGRVCVRKCEVKCLRNRVDKSVGINFVKRYIADHATTVPATPPHAVPTGKHVAIVGGGPAGLTCANYLALKGHATTIFEALPKLGGMLRYGIPEYRLPRIELDEEIRTILDLGIRVETSKMLGRDFTIDGLLEQERFDAVFLAMGARLGKKMGVRGEDEVECVRSALEFLRSVELQGPPVLHGKVAVVGGGNSAIDAARTAIRCGSDEVTILYRRTRKEMPAYPEEVDAAEREGVKFEFLVAPLELVTGSNGRLKGILCQRMMLGQPDAGGRRLPVPIEGSKVELSCDHIFAAIGQDTDLNMFQKEPDRTRPGVSRRATLEVDGRTMATRAKGVFAGGDAVIGPSAVIDAIAHGHAAAEAIDAYLKSGAVESHDPPFTSRRGESNALPEWLFEHVTPSTRSVMPERTPCERVRDFAQVEIGLAEPDMKREARRCMECGCSAVYKCDLKRYAVEYGVHVGKFEGGARKHRVDRSHPLITLDSNKCILCGRCIRACSDIVGLGILGFVGRGFGTIVQPARGVSMGESECIACGDCVESCPTGAIAARLPYGRQGPWRTRKVRSVCNFCSIGCELDLNVVSNGLLWATSPEDSQSGSSELCWKGRFGTGLIHGAERLRTPLVRRNGKHVEVGWDEAIETAANELRQYGVRREASPISVIAAPRMTIEEAVLVRRLAITAMGTLEVGSFGENRRGGPRHDLDGILGETASTSLQTDIDGADVILLSGADPSRTHPVLAMAIRRAARRGAAILAVNSSRIDLIRSGDLWLDARRGTAGIVYAAIMSRLLRQSFSAGPGLRDTELASLKSSVSFASLDMAARISGIGRAKIEECAEIFSSSRKIVAIYDLDETLERASDDLLLLAETMILTGRDQQPGQGLLLLRCDCNSEGGRIAGIANSLHLDSIGGALVMFENPCADFRVVRECRGFEPLVVIDHFLTETGQRAAVILPAATLAESNGTIVTYDRRVKPITAASSPPARLTTAEIIARLAAALGSPVHSVDPVRIRADLARSLGITSEEFERARSLRLPLHRRSNPTITPSTLSQDTTALDGNNFSYATLDGAFDRRISALGLHPF